MFRRAASVTLAAALFTLAPQAAPVPDAEAILRHAFDNYRSASSQTHITMTVHRADWERHLDMKVWTRGQDDALVRFTAPPKDAGNATLKRQSETWVYNPLLNQVIKLPASMMSQSWMGSDFSYNDLSKSEDIITQFKHRVIATQQSGEHTLWTLEAIPKSGAPVIWGKITITIRDDDVVMDEIFFDQDMKPVRRMHTEKIGVLGDRSYPIVMIMRPLEKPGQWTRIETSEGQFDVAVPDYLFTLSNLQNPRL